MNQKTNYKNFNYSKPHKIKKGTIIYRSSLHNNETDYGPKYVTFRKEDRDFYRDYIQGQSNDGKFNEYQYKLKEDLIIPSQDVLKQVQNDVIKNEKNQKEVDYAIEKFVLGDEGKKKVSELKYFDSVKNVSDIADLFQSGKITVEDADTYYDMLQANDLIERVKSSNFSKVSASMMYAKNTKQQIIDILKEKGYNAMVDEAGVGVAGKDNEGNLIREGLEPLIIFDSEKVLSDRTKVEYNLANDNDAYWTIKKEGMDARQKITRYGNRKQK